MKLNIEEAGNNGNVDKTADAKNAADSHNAESDDIADAEMETSAEINTDNLSALSAMNFRRASCGK